MIKWKHLLTVAVMAVAWLGATPDGADGGKSSRLEGRVTDLFGMALKGTEIQLVHTIGKPSREILTDSNGDFSFRRLAAGSYQLRASLPGFKAKTLEVELKTQQVRRVDLGLHLVQLTDDPLCRVTGRVVREGGDEPLPGSLW